MNPSVQMTLRDVHLQKVTVNFAAEVRARRLMFEKTQAIAVPKAKPCVTVRHSVKWEEIPETAYDTARLQRKSTASDLGKSNSWFCRALKGIEKLGWNDLGVISDKTFWSEVVDMICEFHDLPPRGLSAQDECDRRLGRAFREAVQQANR